MSEATTRKIAPHHLEREACLYVRQSSLRQVAQNTESARRQYGLSRKAMALGWPTERIRVIDDDRTRQVYGLPSYREREKKRLRDEGFSTAAEVAEQLDLTPGAVRALGRARNDSRIQRGIITTKGRRYCMYRANCGSEMFHQTRQAEARTAEPAPRIP